MYICFISLDRREATEIIMIASTESNTMSEILSGIHHMNAVWHITTKLEL